MSRIAFLTMLMILSLSAFSQTGTIRGKVTDAEFGDELIGATVVISGTTNGSATDLEGSYTIAKVEPGTYDLDVSFVGYATKKVTGVVVLAGEITVLDITLGGDVKELSEVVITAEALKNSESGVLTAQKKALQVVDGMGAEQFSRGSDNDAASAMKRITGVSVEGGKYVYVRGLGDRYSKTSLNGADIPGLDPNRNTVQMDLFPTNLIDNIMVYKSFSPDLPADFTGGFVNVETKDFPERFTLQFSSKLGFNSQAHFNNDFLWHQGGKLDFLGINDGSRDIPSLITNNQIPVNGGQTTEERDLLNAMGNSFELQEMTPQSRMRYFNQSHSLSIGDQKTLFGKPFGFIAGASYNLGHESYGDGQSQRFTLPGPGSSTLITQLSLNDRKSTESVLWGAFANFSTKLSSTDKISLNLIRNQSSDKFSRMQTGRKPEDDPNLFYETRALGFQERSIASVQLKGEHVVEGLGNMKINWISSYTQSRQSEPDLRFFTYGYEIFDEEVSYSILPSIGQLPTRYFRDMEEGHFDNKIHFTLPLGEQAAQGKIKFGGSYVMKNRAFRENQYQYSSNPTPPGFFDGNPNNYITTDLLSGDKTTGSFIRDAFEDGNNYDADQTVAAGYAMIEKSFFEKLRLVTGVRVESTELGIVSFDPEDQPGTLDNFNLLPSLNMTYSLTEESNLKFGYNRTLARPTFRELAPFVSFDFIGDYLLVGNPTLKQTDIDNIDLRWEMYARPGEMFAISGFYKNFTNPIEKTFNVAAANGNELTWRNTPSATLYGIEAEFRKRLDFIMPNLDDFTLGANVTYVYSRVDIDAQELMILRAFDPNASATRPMFGQSPYIVNSFLSYDNLKGLKANLTYYINGDRLSVVTAGGAPNVIEESRGVLNFNVSKELGRFDLRASANNLLNPEYKFTQTFQGTEYVFQNSRVGATYSLGFAYRVN